MNTPASLDDSLTSAFDAVLRSIDHVVEDTITEGARLAQKIVSRERAVFEERYATAEAEKAELSSQIRSLELQLVDAETLFTAKCIEAEELNKKNEAQAVRIQQLEHLQHGIEATEAGDSNPAARPQALTGAQPQPTDSARSVTDSTRVSVDADMHHEVPSQSTTGNTLELSFNYPQFDDDLLSLPFDSPLKAHEEDECDDMEPVQYSTHHSDEDTHQPTFELGTGSPEFIPPSPPALEDVEMGPSFNSPTPSLSPFDDDMVSGGASFNPPASGPAQRRACGACGGTDGAMVMCTNAECAHGSFHRTCVSLSWDNPDFVCEGCSITTCILCGHSFQLINMHAHTARHILFHMDNTAIIGWNPIPKTNKSPCGLCASTCKTFINCITGAAYAACNTSYRFHPATLSNCTNIPILCPICPEGGGEWVEAVWRYNLDQHFEEAGHQPVKGNAQVSFEERFALGVDSSEDEDEDGDQDQMGDEQVEKGSQSGSDTSFSGDDDV